MSSLSTLLSKLQDSGYEKLCLVPGEPVHALDESARKHSLGGGPVREAVVLEAVAEVLSNDDIRALSTNRPRIVRHPHEGRDFVLEIVRGPSGVALFARLARTAHAKPAAREARRSEPARRATARPTRSSKASIPAVSNAADNPRSARAPDPLRIDSPGEPVRTMPVATPIGAYEPIELAADVRLKPEAPARVAPRVDELLREMVAKRASDLHLSTGGPPVMRVDGEIHFLRERPTLASDDIRAILFEIMPPKARAEFDAQNDADFAYELPGLARFRVNAFVDRNGAGAVLRQIPIEILSTEKLGLPRACLDLCWLTKGLVVVTGPTGSGKSTTLAAMIDYINRNRSDHIVTIEDPVEFVHTNQKCLVNQREVGQHTKSFKNALRAALREDPDIVLVGEMRDLETIAIAIETAETGHLVFGTLHTTTATSTVDRIIDQFPSDRQAQIRVMLSESLKGVIAQVLLPKLGGGRVAAHEILLGSPAVSALVRDGKTFQLASVMQTAKGQGMTTMNDSLLGLVQRKQVEPKVAWTKAVDKNGLLAMFKSAGIPTNFT